MEQATFSLRVLPPSLDGAGQAWYNSRERPSALMASALGQVFPFLSSEAFDMMRTLLHKC